MVTDKDYLEFERCFDGKLRKLFKKEKDPELKEIIRQAVLKARILARDRWYAKGNPELIRIRFEEPE